MPAGCSGIVRELAWVTAPDRLGKHLLAGHLSRSPLKLTEIDPAAVVLECQAGGRSVMDGHGFGGLRPEALRVMSAYPPGRGPSGTRCRIRVAEDARH